MQLVASTFHTISEHGDVNTSAASSPLNWRPYRFKWSLLFRRKTKCGFCVCAITFQLASACGNFPPGIYRPGLEASESSPSRADLKMNGALPPLQICAFLPCKGMFTFFKLPEHNAFFWRPRGYSKGTEDSSMFAPPDSARFLLLLSVVVVSSFLQWSCGSNRYFNYGFSKLNTALIMWGGAQFPSFFRRFRKIAKSDN